MDNENMIQNFGDLVNATGKLASPWKKVAFVSMAVTVITNLFWCVIVGMLVYFAYMTPSEMSQEQELPDYTQTQTYTQGATNGE